MYICVCIIYESVCVYVPTPCTHVQVSIHVANSNYSHSSTVHRYVLIIPFSQPPTITHTAPPIKDVNVGEMFQYTFTVASSLSRSIQLDLGQPSTTPSELLDNITILSQQDLSAVFVSGLISIGRVLPLVVQQRLPATIVIPIEDGSNGGVVYAPTQLNIRPSPPLFNQRSYEYSVLESSSNHFLGPFTLIDPNSDIVSVPETNASNWFTVSPNNPSSGGTSPGPYFYFDILILVNLNYEQSPSFSFTMTAIDSVDPTLSSVAMVTINVLPINEFSPVFRDDRYVSGAECWGVATQYYPWYVEKKMLPMQIDNRLWYVSCLEGTVVILSCRLRPQVST